MSKPCHRYEIIDGFAYRLLCLMDDNNVSYRKLSRLTGIGHATISDWLNENHVPNAIGLIKLCNVFHVSADYLLFGTENKFKE